MVQLKHIIDSQKEFGQGNIKGKPSDTLRKIKKRPEGNYHANARKNASPGWTNWELNFKDILIKDEEYQRLEKEYSSIYDNIIKFGKEKNYRGQLGLIKEKFMKIEELNKRYDELKREYEN